MRPSCAAGPQERTGASRGTRIQRGLGDGGVHVPGCQRALSRGWHFPAPKTVPSNSRTSPTVEREPISPWTSCQASTDVAFFAAQLTDSSLALSTRQKGLDTRRGQDQSPLVPSPLEMSRAHVLQGKHQGQALANGSTCARVEIRLLRG